MKRKQLETLSFKKEVISKLGQSQITGGLQAVNAKPTHNNRCKWTKWIRCTDQS